MFKFVHSVYDHITPVVILRLICLL